LPYRDLAFWRKHPLASDSMLLANREKCRDSSKSAVITQLDLLAASRDGCTEAIMLAHGFTIEQICELVYGGAHDDDLGTVLFGRPLRRA
jgi:hypothetical protein